VREQLKVLLKAAVAQQAESSATLQRSECGRAGAPSAHGPNPHPSQHRERGEGGGAATSAVKSRLEPNRDARNTIEARRRAESVDNHHDGRSRHHDDRGRGRCHDSDDDLTAAGPLTREVHGPLAGASATRSFLRASVLRPMYRDTTGTPIPAYGSRTTDSHATSGERQTTSSSSRTCRSTSVTPHAHGSSTCHGTRSTTGPTYVGSSSTTFRAPTCAPASSGSCATASSSRGKSQ
jgi:hypothetical protein